MLAICVAGEMQILGAFLMIRVKSKVVSGVDSYFERLCASRFARHCKNISFGRRDVDVGLQRLETFPLDNDMPVFSFAYCPGHDLNGSDVCAF